MSNEVKSPEVNAETPQCQFFVQRKKRLCRMTVKPGRRYCGEHTPQPATDAGEVDKRIPCPNDPKHTCYASKLLKHLAICNARRTEQPAYIVENINAPEEVASCPRRPLSTIPKEELIQLIDKVNHLYGKYLEEHIKEEPPQPIHHTVAPEFAEPDRAESSLRHLRQTSALLWLTEREGLVRDNTCYVELGAGKGQLSYYACHAWCGGAACGGSGGCRGRVLAVDRAPLRHKRDNKLRSNPPKTGVVESFSQMQQDVHDEVANDAPNDQLNQSSNKNENANRAQPNSQVGPNTHAMSVEVNRTDDKHNENDSEAADIPGEDDKLQDTEGSKGGVVKRVRSEVGSEVASRLRADLAHLSLAAAPAVRGCTGVVGLAKHLCGVATDYALRCVAAPDVLEKTHGIVLATCCHHRCERAPYVGSRHLQELGIDAQEFNIMLGVVSWATCGDGRSRQRRAASPSAPPAAATPPLHPKYPITREEREAVGRKAKALLDYGRLLWLRARGFEARLTRFVPASDSPENLCLVARKP